ncbi:hypothetical protein BJ979_003424 [Schumannella luteola]|uniref:Uncharacterized protein n=1 Tax=Schumannella luteola TaxID=472059 RepID=A0A852YNQ6_9MICO|nr:hypothetical protein [Schumannella luteola]NYH00799.1 hypothetical protein [Schumannella luteola]
MPWLLLAVLLVNGLVISSPASAARADRRRAEAWMAHVAEQARSEASSPRQSGAPEKLGADR